jgi:hypothetical protein
MYKKDQSCHAAVIQKSSKDYRISQLLQPAHTRPVAMTTESPPILKGEAKIKTHILFKKKKFIQVLENGTF